VWTLPAQLRHWPIDFPFCLTTPEEIFPVSLFYVSLSMCVANKREELKEIG
jgi:hypothetical protein